MAFFKFRKSGDEAPVAPVQGESVEALRKRATFRLIGAAVLVLAGVIGFPLVFDSQPRPVAVDIKIEIPDKSRVKPLVLPSATGASSSGEVVTNTANAPIPMPVVPPTPVTPPPVASVVPSTPEKINTQDVRKNKSELDLSEYEKFAIKKPGKFQGVLII